MVAKDADSLTLFRDYAWASLWQKERCATASDWRSALLAAWWQNPPEKPIAAAQLAIHRKPEPVFAAGIIGLSVGDGALAEAVLKRLLTLHAPGWMSGWIGLELFGRKREFAHQASLLAKFRQDVAWPFAACLQSLDQKEIDPAPLLAYFEAHPPAHPLAEILVGRLLTAAGKEELSLARLSALIPSLGNHADLKALAHYHLAYAATKALRFDLAIRAFDAAAQGGFIDIPTLSRWINLALSYPGAWSSVPARIAHAITLVPDDDRTKSAFAANALIFCWINAEFAKAFEVVKTYHNFQNLPEKPDDRNEQIFFRYVLYLCAYWQLHPEIYSAPDPGARLHVLGESHALSPANAPVAWHGSRYLARSHFVMGVKMWHLAREQSGLHREMLKLRIEQLPEGAEVLFCIGEIDCRPNEGIWSAARKQGRAVLPFVEMTVRGYLNRLAELISSRKLGRIVIQGVPAPNYDLSGTRDTGDPAGFLAMIAEVNRELRQGTLSRGWDFLDVYAATANETGTSNRAWHLDPYHLQPGFYTHAEKWLVSN